MASGDTLAVFDALASRPPTSNYATLDVRGEHPVLDFAAAADETAHFGGVLPGGYSGGDVTVRITFSATTAISGDILWEAAFERHQVDSTDLDAAGFGVAVTATSTTAATSGATTQASLTLPAANLGGAVAGEPFRLKITRKGTDAADTLVGDAELLAVETREA